MPSPEINSDGYTVLEHPSDLGIEARGATLAKAFQYAATGLMSIILDLDSVNVREKRSVRLRASDRAQLLVQWLSEILYLFDGRQFACKEFEIHHLGHTELRAVVWGEPFSPSRHHTRLDVKAVTYHQLEVSEDEHGARVRVFLDI